MLKVKYLTEMAHVFLMLCEGCSEINEINMYLKAL